MGEVSRYPNGTFCWIDLGTPDVAGAKSFYVGLFGWDTEDVPAPEGATYTLCRLRGKDVAAIHEQPGREGPGWSSYVSVDQVDASTSRARERGATVVTEPFDVMDAGRTSQIQDPTGAALWLWQPSGRIGAGLVNEVGTWSWNELVTPDVEAARGFYGDLFGWDAEYVQATVPRASLRLGDLLVGGVHAPTEQEGDAARWTVAFTVANADESTERVRELGGRILLPPMDVQAGRFAIVSDPTGAAFTLAAVPGGPVGGVDGL